MVSVVGEDWGQCCSVVMVLVVVMLFAVVFLQVSHENILHLQLRLRPPTHDAARLCANPQQWGAAPLYLPLTPWGGGDPERWGRPENDCPAPQHSHPHGPLGGAHWP